MCAEFIPDGDFVPDEDEDEDGMPVRRRAAPEVNVVPQEAVPKELGTMFDPAALAHEFLTKEDLQIKSVDMPERFQLRIPDRALPDGRELTLEAQWIFKQCFVEKRGAIGTGEQVDLTSKIRNVLHFMRVDLLEIPFIYQYRNDYVAPLMTEEECWDVYEWDEKWHRLSVKKENLLALYGDKEEIVALGGEERYIDLISQAETDEELNDLTEYFNFYFYEKRKAAEEEDDAPRYKRPTARDIHSDSVRLGLSEHAKKFGISAAQFGENMWNNQMVHIPEDEPQFPEDFAHEHLTEQINTTEKFLSMCRVLLAKQMANDPSVKQALRSVYLEKAKINTFETVPKGLEEITYWHPYRDVKRLDQVPMREFRNSDKFALIMEAEKAGFIKVTIDFDHQLRDEMVELYESKSYEPVAVSWNKQRRAIVLEAWLRYLLPRIQKEIRAQLEEWTFDYICRRAAATLRNHIEKGPFVGEMARIFEDEYPYRGPKGKHVMAICVPDDSQESPFAVVLNRVGELSEFAKISFFEHRGGNAHAVVEETTRQLLQRKDAETVQKLILKYRPGLIVVGAHPGAFRSRFAFDALGASRDGPSIGPVLEQIINDLEKQPPRIVPAVHWVDGRIAQVFRNTKTARAEFAEFSAPLRQAISLGRSVLDPLAEWSRLWDEKRSVTFVPLHRFQTLVPQRQLLNHLERAFVQTTCMIGVDVNQVVRHGHLSAPLQFVPGLGPRKARQMILSCLNSGKFVQTREGDIKSLLKGPAGSEYVYTNAAAYLRIVPPEGAPDVDLMILDNTRIHPNEYRFAYKIASDALEVEHQRVNEDEAERNAILRKAMSDEHRHEIIRVEVEGIADVWRENYQEEKLRLLQALKEEMLNPFGDKRLPFMGISREEAFHIVSGADRETMPQGKVVNCLVRMLRKYQVNVSLDDGINGYIRLDDLTDETHLPPEELVKPGQMITARVLGIDYDRWEVQLTSKDSDLKNTAHWEPYDRLSHYLQWAEAELDRVEAEKERIRREEEKLQNKRRFGAANMRTIDHPLFRNFNQEQARQELQDAPCGEAIFRPSTKGMEFLTLSFKGLGDVVAHVVIAEKEKKNEAALGRKLQIKGVTEEFEDLDEVIVRYMNPIRDWMLTLSRHRRFHSGTAEEIEEALREEKKENPSIIPYKIGLDYNNPGWFTIYYIPNVSVHHETISIRPNGFRLWSRTFENLKQMLDWWKQNWKDKKEKARKQKPARRKY